MIKNERGSALVLTILVMLMFTILGSAFVMVSTGEGLQAIRHEQNTQAHYNARSGVYMAGKWLEAKDGIGELEKFLEELEGQKEIIDENGGDIKVWIKKYGENMVNIESTGRDKKQDYTIRVEGVLVFEKVESNENKNVLPDGIGNIDMAIFTNVKNLDSNQMVIEIKGGNNTSIKGSVGANTSIDNQIKFTGKNTIIEGKYLYLPHNNEGVVQADLIGDGGEHRYPVRELKEEREYSEIDFPEFPNIYSDEFKGEFKKVNMSNTELNDLSGSDLDENTSFLSQSGDIRTFKGDIYIDAKKDGLDIKNRDSIKKTVFKGNVYIDAGSKNITIDNSNFEGNVHLVGGNVVLKDTEFKGNLHIEASGGIQTGSGSNRYHSDVVMISGGSTIQVGNDDFYKSFYSKAHNIYIQDGNNNFFGNDSKVVIDAENSIEIKSTPFKGDVYMRSNNKDIQIKENVVFDKNLFINGGGKVQFQKIKVGGLVYAPSRYLDFQKDAKIDYAVVANSLRFKGKTTINFNNPNDKESGSNNAGGVHGAGSNNQNKSKLVENIIVNINDAKWSKGKSKQD